MLCSPTSRPDINHPPPVFPDRRNHKLSCSSHAAGDDDLLVLFVSVDRSEPLVTPARWWAVGTGGGGGGDGELPGGGGGGGGDPAPGRQGGAALLAGHRGGRHAQQPRPLRRPRVAPRLLRLRVRWWRWRQGRTLRRRSGRRRRVRRGGGGGEDHQDQAAQAQGDAAPRPGLPPRHLPRGDQGAAGEAAGEDAAVQGGHRPPPPATADRRLRRRRRRTEETLRSPGAEAGGERPAPEQRRRRRRRRHQRAELAAVAAEHLGVGELTSYGQD
uniref:DUF834 domain-containing protein n=1 Tax=Oryza rufipogon TaxID=4529 RepID=A0A0E0QJ37_ORYRU